MPRSLTARISLAFAAITLAIVVAVGGALFVVLKTLHTEQASSGLADIGQTLLAQARPQQLLNRDARALLADLQNHLRDRGISVHVVAANGRIVDLGDPLPVDHVPLDLDRGRGDVDEGVVRTPQGPDLVWAAVAIRGPDQLGPQAVLLSMPDHSGADAIRDLIRTLPVVVVVAVLVGAVATWLLTRSVAGPLRRLATATADLATTSRLEPLPLDGPTEVRDLTDRFNAMAAELGDTRRREAELLANLRHDLRTPLTVIAGFATALSDGTATGDDVGRAARAIGEEAERLERLVAELGAIESIRAGAGSLRPEPLGAREVLAEAVERFRPAAAARGVELDLVPAGRTSPEPAETPEAAKGSAGGRKGMRTNARAQAVNAAGAPAITSAEISATPGDSAVRPDQRETARPLTFAADRLAVDRILANLVSNALAALTDGGHIWLDARAIQGATAAENWVALTVTDDGPGFPPGATDRVFERFYRGDVARSGGGSGLGMSIVRDLARAHGGTAHAENMAPRGARVSVILPLVPRLDDTP